MYIISRIRSFWFYSSRRPPACEGLWDGNGNMGTFDRDSVAVGPCMRDWDVGVGTGLPRVGYLTPQHPRMVCAMWHFSFGELEFGRLRRLEIKKGLRGQSRKAHSEVPTVGKVVNHQVGQHRQPARTRGWANPPETLSSFRSLGRRYALHRTSGEKNVSRN